MKQQHRSSLSCPGPKFVRRADLSPIIRFSIGVTALLAQQQHQWGVITRLAREYVISRTFVYMLAFQVAQAGEVLFGAPRVDEQQAAAGARMPYASLLSLRLEGGCSLNAISMIMERFGLPWSSVGKLSETLRAIGGLLDNTVSLSPGTVRLVVFASDEIFAGTQPILVTVDPQSSAILRLEVVERRQWEAWARHWTCLYEHGCQALYLVCDGGQALAKARKEALANVRLQPDTYHALAHILGPWKARLEQRAYAAIRREYRCWHILDSARSDRVILKRIAQYDTACQQTEAAITRYDAVAYCYHILVDHLAIFDGTGRVCDRTQAEDEMQTALNLLDTLGISALSAAVAKVRRTLPDLLAYLDDAPAVVTALVRELPVAPATFRLVCQAHHWHNRAITATTANARHVCRAREQALLDRAAQDLWYSREIQEHMYTQLDRIVRSSSLVECINSFLRPYLNTTRNHVTQELLNLIMFYHNHRRYRAGKRATHTPMELLTGQPQEADWLELLCDEVERKQPGFFTTSH